MAAARERRQQTPAASSSQYRYAPPRLHVARPYELTHGARAAAHAEMHGKHLMRWQLDVLNDWGAVGEDMQFLHRRNGASIPRQVGKSDDAVEWASYLADELGMGVLYTAHNYSTTCEMLRRFREIYGTKANDPTALHPRFNRMVRRVENKTAQEAFFLKNGGRIHFSTRTKTATLGFSFDVIIYDEAQELTVQQMQAIAATTSSGRSHNPQEIYLGTPARPGSYGDVFGPMRAEAHAGPDEDLSWWEWGTDEVGDIAEERRWYAVNPSLAEGVADINSIRLNCRKFAKLGDEGVLAFAQEFMGYWLPEGRSEPPEVSRDEWDELATDDPPREGGKVAFAFKFSLDGARVALAACRKAEDGRSHVEIVAYRSLSEGMSWCADFCEARKSTAAGFVVDGGGNARDLADELRRRGLRKSAVVVPAAADVAAACAKLVNGVRERSFSHFGQPALDECMASMKKRQIGRTGFGFEGIGGEDPTMAEAAALALWGVDAIKRNPNRKAVVR